MINSNVAPFSVGSKSASGMIALLQNRIDSIELSDPVSMLVGDSIAIQAQAKDSSGILVSGWSVDPWVWSTDTPLLIDISDKGIVTALDFGVASVSIVSSNGTTSENEFYVDRLKFASRSVDDVIILVDEYDGLESGRGPNRELLIGEPLSLIMSDGVDYFSWVNVDSEGLMYPTLNPDKNSRILLSYRDAVYACPHVRLGLRITNEPFAYDQE